MRGRNADGETQGEESRFFSYLCKMEEIGGLLGFLLMIGIGIASAIDKQKKAARKPVSPTSGRRSPGPASMPRPAAWPVFGASDEFSAPSPYPHSPARSVGSVEPVENAEASGYGIEAAGYNAETAPRRAVALTSTAHPASTAAAVAATQNVDNEQITFDPATDFDLRRAVIEAEILTPKYF